MARKDVPTLLVLKAYEKYRNDVETCTSYSELKFPYEILSEWTGEHENVCYRAMERDEQKGYIEYGTSLRTGWLTKKGEEYLREGENK